MLVSARSSSFRDFHISGCKNCFYISSRKTSCSLTLFLFLIRARRDLLSPRAGREEGTEPVRIWSESNRAAEVLTSKLAGCIDINHDDYTLASYASRLEIVVNPISKFEPGNWREITAMPCETRQTSRMCLSGTCVADTIPFIG
jgi:hypothetical protein